MDEAVIVKVLAFNNINIEPIEKDGMKYFFAVPEMGHGSGTMIASNGVILTAKHVIQNTRFIAVWIPGTRLVLPAEAVYIDEREDFALIAVQGSYDKFKSLKTPVPAVRVAQEVWAYGYPIFAGEPEPSITRGIVSRWSKQNQLWQMDTSINSGNSGGPVADFNGDVVGIAISGVKREIATGMNFFLPVGEPSKIFIELKNSGRIDAIKRRMNTENPHVSSLKTMLSEYLGKVLIADEKQRALLPGKSLDSMNELQRLDSEKLENTSEIADISALVSVTLWNQAMLDLMNDGVDIKTYSNLPREKIENISKLINGSIYTARMAMRNDQRYNKSGFIQMLNKIGDEIDDENKSAKYTAPIVVEKEKKHISEQSSPGKKDYSTGYCYWRGLANNDFDFEMELGGAFFVGNKKSSSYSSSEKYYAGGIYGALGWMMNPRSNGFLPAVGMLFFFGGGADNDARFGGVSIPLGLSIGIGCSNPISVLQVTWLPTFYWNNLNMYPVAYKSGMFRYVAKWDKVSLTLSYKFLYDNSMINLFVVGVGF